MKKIIPVIILLALPLVCFAQDATTKATMVGYKVSEDFKKDLTIRTAGDISIMIPAYLKDIDFADGKAFVNTDKTIKMAISFKQIALPDDLRRAVSSMYEYWEKVFYPGINPVFLFWNRSYKSSFKEIERMEKIEVGDARGFITKGIKTVDGKAVYSYDYNLFRKTKGEEQLGVAIFSDKGYFLSDQEGDYIISTIKLKK